MPNLKCFIPQESSKSIQIEAFHVFKVRFVKKYWRQCLQWMLNTQVSGFLLIINEMSSYSLLINISHRILLVYFWRIEASCFDCLLISRQIKVDISSHLGLFSLGILAAFQNIWFLWCRGWTIWGRQSSGCQRNCGPWTPRPAMNRLCRKYNAGKWSFPNQIVWINSLLCPWLDYYYL